MDALDELLSVASGSPAVQGDSGEKPAAKVQIATQ
jgi:hypothetical protein